MAPDPGLLVALASGAAGAAGGWLIAYGVMAPQARLSDALALLDPERVDRSNPAGSLVILVSDPRSRLERAAAWAYQHLRLPLSARTAHLLQMQGRSVGDLFAEKFVLALAGLTAPTLLGLLSAWWRAPLGPMPMVVALVAGCLGWFWPDLQLGRRSSRLRQEAGEALTTFFDLVYLERLANKSAAQAMQAAAEASDNPIFRRIRTALDRAKLRQQPPWEDVRLLAREWSLPELADIADVLQLDEQGAALSEALQARVQEIRDAHLLAERVRAQEASERMSLWMTFPVMIFALMLLTPPLLRLTGLAP